MLQTTQVENEPIRKIVKDQDQNGVWIESYPEIRVGRNKIWVLPFTKDNIEALGPFLDANTKFYVRVNGGEPVEVHRENWMIFSAKELGALPMEDVE